MFHGQSAASRPAPPPRANRRAAALATFAGSGLTVAVTVIQAFVVVPLALVHVGPALYSGWLAASELLIWLQLLDAGLPNLLVQRAGARAGAGDWAGAARWASTTIAAVTLIAAVLLGVAVLLAPTAAAWLAIEPGSRDSFIDAFRLGAVGSALLMSSNTCVALARGLQRTALVSTTQLAGALAGLLGSVGLLLAGWGIWALAFGLLARGVIALAGAIVFLARLPPAGASWWRSPSPQVARELVGLAPYTSVASVGYVVANNSEVLLATALLGPMPALAYALTRRAFDGVRTLLETIVWAVSGGFAHLVTAADRHRARAVLGDIAWGRLAAASVVLGMVVAVNESFVTLLFGGDNFAGTGLTIAFAVQIMLGGQSFLVNYLWRSAGAVREGSLALGIEALLRVGTMAVGLALIGPLGAPLAASVVGVATLAWAHRGLSGILPAGSAPAVPASLRWAPVVMLGLASGLALAPVPVSWVAVVAVAAAVGACGVLLLWRGLPPDLKPARLQRARLS